MSKAQGPCGRCGRDPASGYASIDIDGVETWFCHGGEQRVSCYEQETWGRGSGALPPGYHAGWVAGERWVMDHLGDYTRLGRTIRRVRGGIRRAWCRITGRPSGTYVVFDATRMGEALPYVPTPDELPPDSGLWTVEGFRFTKDDE